MLPSPRALERGRFAVVTERWRGLRWTLRRQVLAPDETFAAYGEVVWSWRRDPGVYPPRLCGVGNGDNKGRSPGRARISRKAIARGKPGCPGCTCGLTRVHFCSTPTHMGLRAQSAPGFPCALFKRGPTKLQNSGESAPRERKRMCNPHGEERPHPSRPSV